MALFADRLVAEHLSGHNLKASTLVDYRLTIERHLKPALGDVELAKGLSQRRRSATISPASAGCSGSRAAGGWPPRTRSR